MTLVATGPNADQICYWNETSGPKWVRLADTLDGQISPLGLRAMERIGIASGQRVLDVGCGCGQSSRQLAERVGPSGAVIGIDVSATMLAEARARSGAFPQLSFLNADAQLHDFGATRFDRIFSRFGVMFFADPAAAFRNLLAALRADGRLGFVCWQPIDRNPWMALPARALRGLVELPAPPAPGAPGPFSLGDRDHLRALLADAGYRRVEIEPLEQEVALAGGAPLEEAVSFALEIGPAAAAVREAGRQDDPAVREAVRAALAPYAGPGGVVMRAAAWIAIAEP